MSHIQLTGDPQAVEAARALLAGWGMTSVTLDPWRDRESVPTVDDCDAVLLALDTASGWVESNASFLPTPSEGQHNGACPAPAAPLLLLGPDPGRILLSREAWQVVEEPGPGGSDLRFALQACVDRARRLRGTVDGNLIQEDYFHFLGHELRSPLTAVKTALEVLQGDLGGLLEDEVPDGADRRPHPSLKMLEIGLRNVRRLQDTVNWSQDLLDLSRGHFRADNRPVTSADLLAGLGLDTVRDETPDGTRVQADPELLAVLAGQLVRLLGYLGPGAGVEAVLRQGGGAGDPVALDIRAAGAAVGPEVSRTRLAHGPEDRLVQWQDLAGFVVARPLLDELHARLDVRRLADGRPCATLLLPRAEAPATDGDPVETSGLLHTHA